MHCLGKYYQPRYHDPYTIPQDYGTPVFYTDIVNPTNYSNYNYRSNLTSPRYLCHVLNWTQGMLITLVVHTFVNLLARLEIPVIICVSFR